MRLLVTRPEPDAEETADALRAQGFDVMVAPMLTVVPREEQSIDLLGIQAICFTSRNGVRVFANRFHERTTPVYAVGPGTAFEARANGFTAVHECGGDGRSMARDLHEALSPAAGTLLHARGAAVAYDLAGALADAGFAVREVVLYETLPVPALPPAVRQAWRAGELDGVLLFSPRSANILAKLLTDAGLAEGAKNVTAYCLSETVRKAAGLPWRAVRVASQPDVPAMIRLLEGDEGAMADERKPGEETDSAESAKPETAEPASDQPGEPKPDERNRVEAIIAKFGGLRPMASKLDLAVSTVQGWKIRGHIPDQRHEEILRAAKENDILLTAEELSAPATSSAESLDQAGPGAQRTASETASSTETKSGRPSPLPASGVAPSGEKAAAGPENAKAPEQRKTADGSGAQPEAAEPASPASAAAKAASTATAASSAAASAPPPVEVEHARRGGFMPGLLVGALLCGGAAVATVALRDSWMPMVEETAEVETKLQTLADDVEAMGKEMAAFGNRAQSLESTLQSLAERPEAAPAANPEELASLNAEVKDLGAAVQSLRQAFADATSEAEKDQELENAALMAEVAAVGQVLETLSGDLTSQFESLARNADGLAKASEELAASVAENQAGIQAQSAELAALSGRIDALENQASSQQLAERSALLLAFERLSDAVDSGESYDQPLAFMGDLAGDRAPAEAVASLQKHAASGVQPLTGLQSSFKDAGAAIIAASYEDTPSEGVVGDVMRNLTKLVVVRSRDAESAGVDGVVARAEASLNGRDLAGAVAELEGLEGEPAEAAGAWLDEARARIAVDAALAEISAAMDAAPGAAAN